jgi:MFS family permease
MGTGMGIFTLGAGIAQMVSPTTALYISHLFGYKTLFFVAAGVMALVIVLAFNISMPARERRPFKISVKNIIAKEALAPAFLLFCTYSCYSLVNSFLVVFATEKGLGLHIGYFFTVYAVMLFGVRPIAGYLFDRWGSSVLIPFFALFVTAFFVISFASELWEFLLAAVIFALGYGSCQPVLQAMTMKLVPSERRGAGSSTNFIGSDLGNLVGPSLGGLVAENFGYPAMWRVMTISLIIAIGTVVILRKRLARKQGVATSAGSSIR